MRDPAGYWRANRRVIAALLVVWALVSIVLPILLARPLARFSVGSLPMGFWWAQQGSIIVFVILIFAYALIMDRVDARYGAGEDAALPDSTGSEGSDR